MKLIIKVKPCKEMRTTSTIKVTVLFHPHFQLADKSLRIIQAGLKEAWKGKKGYRVRRWPLRGDWKHEDVYSLEIVCPTDKLKEVQEKVEQEANRAGVWKTH